MDEWNEWNGMEWWYEWSGVNEWASGGVEWSGWWSGRMGEWANGRMGEWASGMANGEWRVREW